MIYAIEAENGFVKIGISYRPQGRLEAILTHSPLKVRMIAMWDGNQMEEGEIHTRFHVWRSHTEWFRPEGDFAAFVESIRGRGLSRIEEWDEIGVASTAAREAERVAKISARHKKLWADPEYRARRALRRQQKEARA